MGVLLTRILAVIATAIAGIGGGVAVFEVQSDNDILPSVEMLASKIDSEIPAGPETAAVSDGTLFQASGSYMGDYTIDDTTYGTEVHVTVAGDMRTIAANALPNHATGDFPNSGNPNTISAQSNTYTYPVIPTWTGAQTWAREPGVAINGVKFEPETAERVSCSSGETYRVEAVQGLLDLGLDFNNAHVQPTGAYHYHGVSPNLAAAFDSGGDLVHVGFAADGYLMYYSKSGAYNPSYRVSSGARTGSSCTLSVGRGGGTKSITVAGVPDGTYVSDWEYVEGLGSLDACNGTEIDGTYAYLITEDYPYVSRCLNGSFTQSGPGGQQGSGTGDGPQGARSSGSSRSGGPGTSGPGGSPPVAATSVCSNKSNGASCSFSTPRGSVSGSCLTPPGGSGFVCVPG